MRSAAALATTYGVQVRQLMLSDREKGFENQCAVRQLLGVPTANRSSVYGEKRRRYRKQLTDPLC
jgi:hypothetical protein